MLVSRCELGLSSDRRSSRARKIHIASFPSRNKEPLIMLMLMVCKKSACHDANGYRPVESINQTHSLNARRFFHVVEDTSRTLPVLPTALHGPILRVPTNRHVARQLERSVPHASVDLVSNNPLCIYVKSMHVSATVLSRQQPRLCGWAVRSYLEVCSAELLQFPRFAVVVGDPSEELRHDLRVCHHKVLREGRAAGFAGGLPYHWLFDLSCYQCSQERHLFVEIVGIELGSVIASR